MDWFFEKGTPLPAKHRDIYHTVHDVKRGESSDVIKIPVKEGQNKRADRNNEIGRLEINASQVKRDVQAGSEVEVYIAINESRIMTVKAYIPLLDEEYENVVHLEKTTPDIDKLQKGLEREKERLEKLRKAAQETGDAAARKVLLRIDGERMVHDVKAALAAARNDDDAANKCSKRLLDLAIALDEVEEILEWPKLVADSEKLLADVRKNVLRLGNDEEKQLLERHETDLKAAFLSRDPSLLRQRDAELWFFYVKFLDRVGVYQVWTFEDLVAMKSQMIDQAKAEQLIAQGQRALNNNDYEGLRVVNNQLRTLLPSPPAPPGEDRGSLGRRFVI
jgi:molecular chaperone DnaK